MNTKQRIGWIGVGKMGTPMATNLLKAGYKLTVFDIIPAAMKALVDQGATPAESPLEVADQADIIISMIPDDAALEEVSTGTQGIFQCSKPGLVYIDMSTVSPAASARIGEMTAEKGIQYLRAPVSGSTESAVTAALTILASGPKDAFDQCRPIFDTLGQKVFYVGPGDQGRYLKLLVNMMVGITSAMTAEALVFGKRGGIEWDQMIDIINNSVVASPLIEFKVQLLKERGFAPMFTAAQMAKDFDLALDSGRKTDTPMPLTALVRQLYGAMKATGKGELDYFGLVTLIEEMAGIKN
ncbi:MAG: NAD(P)-dependent oxidoreductase [Desulfobacterales bacterium]|jgi:3-hydroxyisobutyrate dehydrogenase-like beta-hydroxyacid dehydrogenase